MKSEFSRVNLLPNYVFAEINQLKAKLRKKGNDIIDFGMGNPDMPTPKHIRDKLKEVVDKPLGILVVLAKLFFCINHLVWVPRGGK